MYKTIWTPHLGEELVLATENGNLFDRHAVAVIKDGEVVGHGPLATCLRSSNSFQLKCHVVAFYVQPWHMHGHVLGRCSCTRANHAQASI